LVQLNVSLLVAQSTFKPYKHEIVCRSKAIHSPGGTCRHLLVIIITGYLSVKLLIIMRPPP